jgi:hypothetical protein
VVVAAKVEPLLALELLLRNSIWAKSQLVVQRAEKLLNKRVRVLAIEEFRALVPVSIISDVRAFLKVVKVKMRGSSEVLLSMRVIALRPLMLLVDVRAEARLV